MQEDQAKERKTLKQFSGMNRYEYSIPFIEQMIDIVKETRRVPVWRTDMICSFLDGCDNLNCPFHHYSFLGMRLCAPSLDDDIMMDFSRSARPGETQDVDKFIMYAILCLAAIKLIAKEHGPGPY